MTMLSYADVALKVLLQSTAPSSCKSAWVNDFNRQAEIAEARALLGPRNALAASARVERGIRQAIGPWPANGLRPKVEGVLHIIRLNGPAFYGLNCVPHKDTVSAVIKLMAAEHES